MAPKVLDATKCISYWTIEVSKVEPPAELASKFGYNFFGCDICQDVCPWNKKARKRFENDKSEVSGQDGFVDPKQILALSDAELKSQTKLSAMSRAKPHHLKRNAEILIRNLNTGHKR
jgi:epoxyqueuosine reductase